MVVNNKENMMSVSNNNKFGWVKLLSAIVVILALGFIAYIYPSYKSHEEFDTTYQTLTSARENLELLVEAQDLYFQANGNYLAIKPDGEGLESRKLLNWCTSSCTPCDFGVTVLNDSFTASSKCPTGAGKFKYSGYVRVPLGKHVGVEGVFSKCLAKGIYAGSRHLVMY